MMAPKEVHALAVAHGMTRDLALIATAIAWAESGLRPDAIGDVDLEDAKWGPSVGLWQVRSLRSHTGTGKDRDVERLGDPSFNARSMVTISAGGTNWAPWSVYKNGRYLAHIDDVRAALEGGAMDGWMPDVIHTPPNSRTGLAWLAGTAWKLVLHTTESNYRRSQGGRVNYHGHQSYPHFEVSEEAIEQYLPITVGAYALAGSTSLHGAGNAAHAVQIEIVWAAANAANMPEALLTNIARVLTFLRQQTGMAPNLPPQGFPARIDPGRYWFDRDGWYAFEGLCGHGNVPGNFDRWDPGPLPAERIVALSNAEMGSAPTPVPEEEFTMFIGDAPPERGGGVWQSDGVTRKPVRTGDTWSQLGDDGARVAKHIGVFKVGTFDDLIDIEAQLASLRPVAVEGELIEGEPLNLDALAEAVAAKVGDRLAAMVADLIHERLAS